MTDPWENPSSMGTPRGDLQAILDAVTRGLIVVIGAAAAFLIAFLADFAAVRWTH